MRLPWCGDGNWVGCRKRGGGGGGGITLVLVSFAVSEGEEHCEE
jgi:hypothetical protein